MIHLFIYLFLNKGSGILLLCIPASLYSHVIVVVVVVAVVAVAVEVVVVVVLVVSAVVVVVVAGGGVFDFATFYWRAN